MRRVIIAGVLLLAAIAHAADELDTLASRVDELDGRLMNMTARLKPPAGPGPEAAERRLVDGQVLYELKNYDAAAIVLLDVVERYPQTRAYPEALWLLADALYLKRDFLSSRRFYEKIDAKHPKYQLALQRLIELSLHTGDYSPVEGYIAKLEALPASQQSPSVPYVKGKYWFFRQQYDKALAAMRSIPPGHEYYFHALYFIGASLVAKGGGNLQEAEVVFAKILDEEKKRKDKKAVIPDGEKRIIELAHLGLARIYAEEGQISKAMAEYDTIPQRSDLYNDALYEAAWAAIKAKDYVRAARSLDLLVTNAPDSPLIPEVKLLLGALRLRQKDYAASADSFTRARDEYEPLHRQLESELKRAGGNEAQFWFREQIAKNLSKFELEAMTSPQAARWLKLEAQVGRVSTLIGDETELRKSIEESNDIARRLENAVNGPARVNVFPELATARARAIEIAAQATEVKRRLGQIEMQMLLPAAGADRPQLELVDRDRVELEAQLSTLPSTVDSIAERQRKARAAFNEIDKRAIEAQAGITTSRAATVATVKFYHDQVAKKLRPEQRALAQQEIDGWTAKLEEQQRELDILRREIDDSVGGVGVDDTDLQLARQLKKRLEDLLMRQQALAMPIRGRLSANDQRRAERIAATLDRARDVEKRLDEFNARIDAVLEERLKDIRIAIAKEKGHLGGYKKTLAAYTEESTDVGGGVLADNFRAVTNRFYSVVVRADVGIVDVAWALKDSSTRETNKLMAERKRELKMLDDEYKDVLKEPAPKGDRR